MDQEKWICECGHENDDAFCRKCGKAKPDVTATASVNPADMYIQLTMQQMKLKQQEIEQSEKRIAREEELRRQQVEYNKNLKEYNERCAQIPVQRLKKWSSSWIVLVLAILVSVTLAFTVVSAATGISLNIFTIVTKLVKILIAALACAGFWKAYKSGKSADDSYDLSGAKMLKGILAYKNVMFNLTMIPVMFVAVFLVFAIKEIGNIISNAAGDSLGESLSSLNVSAVGLMVMVLIGVIIVFVVFNLYYSSVTKFAKHTIDCFNKKCAPTQKVTMAAVFFFIIGAFTLIGVIINIAVTALINDFIGKIVHAIIYEIPDFEVFRSGLQEIGIDPDKLLSFRLSINVFSTIADVVSAATFIFAGILAIKFNKLQEEISTEIQSIPVPELKVD